jgi:hypothetical protein
MMLRASCSVHLPLLVSHDSAGGRGWQIPLWDWFRKRTRCTPSGDDGVSGTGRDVSIVVGMSMPQFNGIFKELVATC